MAQNCEASEPIRVNAPLAIYCERLPHTFASRCFDPRNRTVAPSLGWSIAAFCESKMLPLQNSCLFPRFFSCETFVMNGAVPKYRPAVVLGVPCLSEYRRILIDIAWSCISLQGRIREPKIDGHVALRLADVSHARHWVTITPESYLRPCAGTYMLRW
jgi:hypothetical protein